MSATRTPSAGEIARLRQRLYLVERTVHGEDGALMGEPLDAEFEIRQFLARTSPPSERIEFQDARWFQKNTQIPNERLRHAKMKHQIRYEKLKNGRTLYCVPDAREKWPEDFSHPA